MRTLTEFMPGGSLEEVACGGRKGWYRGTRDAFPAPAPALLGPVYGFEVSMLV